MVHHNRKHWYKGNLHTHTFYSDGDSSPREVARWYREAGYDVLVLTDHNYRTDLARLQADFDLGEDRAFLLVHGEEVTDQYESSSRTFFLHVGAIGTNSRIGPQGGSSVVDVLQRCIEAARCDGAVPSVNHPNFRWSISAQDLAALRDVRHFEIFNGHPEVNNLGGGGAPSLEEVWDMLLTRGIRLFGVAVDDAHVFRRFSPRLANPGRGWVMVRASRLCREALLEALNRGDLYSSTGVELSDVAMDGGELRLRIRPEADFRYKTEFIGAKGRVLHVDGTIEPSYSLHDEDGYVRAKTTSSSGACAWTQPLFADSA